MSQWPGQQGYQYPQQTGYNPQQQQQQLQPQQTGYPGGSGFLQPQRTGFQGAGFGQQQLQGGIPPVPPLPTGNASYLGGIQQRGPPPPPPQQQFNGGYGSNLQPQQTGFLSASPGPGGGLVPQATGYGGPGPLVPQRTGYLDPRLQMMSSSFLPTNISAPYAPSGAPQLPSMPQGDQSLQQSFQQVNQNRSGQSTVKVPWALSKEERKNYDQIFRAWDTSNTGFINGDTALEVFGQSGLSRNDLATVWSLADQDNRGKLNIQEFHVAMGLIYRRLNGNDLPSVLPPELVPVSSKNLGESVDFLKDLLKNDTQVAGPGDSRGKVHSFRDTPSPRADPRKDGSIYKHDDSNVRGYTSSSRRVNRDNVRATNATAADDLSDIKRQLASTGDRLDRARAEAESRTAEDEALDQELEDLRYRMRRVQEDIDYVSRGPRTAAKEAERRKLERELNELLYTDVPAVEQRIEDRERRKAREKADWSRDRDRRNAGPRGRFDDSPPRRDSDRDRRRGYDDEPERGYLRGTFERDRSRDRDDDRRDRDRDRDRGEYRRRDASRDRDRDRLEEPRSRRGRYDDDEEPPRLRTPAPPPAAKPAASLDAPRPPAPAPSASPAPQTKSMTPAERSAFIRQQAQQRLQDRMKALGINAPAPSASTPVDTSVEDRLAKDRQEAEEKAKQAEKDAEDREAQRRHRLEGERAGSAPKAVPAPAAPAPVPPPATTPKAAPPPPAKRLGKAAPPPPVRHAAPTPPAPVAPTIKAPVPPRAPAPPTAPEEDEDDRLFREREAALKQKRAARQAELDRLEAEAQREEEEHQARLASLRNRVVSPPSTNGRGTPLAPPVAASPVVALAPPVAPPTPVSPPPEPVAAPAPPPPPPAPPAPALATPEPSPAAPRTNPFHKLSQQPSAASSPAAAPSTNPWASAASPASPPVAPPPPPAPAAPVPQSSGPKPKAVSALELDDWDDPVEKDDEDDSSDDEIINRSARIDIANQIFGGRRSTGPEGAPTPPPAPAAPKNIPVFKPSEGPADRGSLLAAIASGTRLKPAKTNDRSASQFAGSVVGGAAPPAHINVAPSSSQPSPPPATARRLPEPEDDDSASNARNMANNPSDATREPTISEGDEDDDDYVKLPNINVQPPMESSPGVMTPADPDPLADIDTTTVRQTRTLFPYTGQRAEDLSFGENLIIEANPSKSGSDWWYGTMMKDGSKGFVPRSYLDVIEHVVQAKALYSYVGGSAEELPFSEGDVLSIIDQSEGDWWKANKGGVVFIVPAAYLEVIDVSGISIKIRDPIPGDDAESVAQLTPVPSFISPTTPSPPIDLHEDDDEDDESDSDSSAYVSFTDSEAEDEDDEEEEDPSVRQQRASEEQEREAERTRVLEAAGLVIEADPHNAPPVPPRRKKSVRVKTRRAPPPVPVASQRTPTADRDLPPTPTDSLEPAPTSEGDAYDKYESYRRSGSHLSGSNRFSMVSMASSDGPSSPVSTIAPSIAPSTSRDGESHLSRFFGGSGLNSFLGRTSSQASSTMEKRTPLVISGPITSGNDTPINRSNSPAFGMSWSSIVDKSALEGIPESERRRQEAIFELIATEGAYVRDLQLIVETFYASLLEMLSTQELEEVFSNIEEILLCNTTFLSSLEARQKESRLYIDSVADILQSHAPSFELYATYCVQQGPAIKRLQSLREAMPQLDAHLNTLRHEAATRNLDLSSYLLIPMQRITRYPLLIKQILKNTEPDNEGEQAGLSTSIRQVERILDRINEAVRDREGLEILAAVSKDLWIGQGRLDLTAPTRYMGPRKLLREGLLVKKKRRLRAFLCTDILVLTDASTHSLYRMPISLIECKVAKSRDEETFQLQLAYPRGGDSLKLRANSQRDCLEWVKTIDRASSKCRQVARELR